MLAHVISTWSSYIGAMYLVRSRPLLAASSPNTSTSRLRIQLVEIMPSAMMPGSPCFFAYASSSWMVGGCG